MPVTSQRADVATEVRQLFDAKAAAWPAKYAPGGRLQDRLSRMASAAAFHVPPGGVVLDLGCGSGELACALAAAGMRTAGCDISAEMLARAAATDQTRTVKLIQLDPAWRRLPLQSRSFDAVVASSVLEYVDQPMTVLRECRRVLRPGGTLLCTVPDPLHPVRLLESLAALAVQVPSISAACDHWPRLHNYVTYLRCSRQRRSLAWWHAAAANAGFCAATCQHDTARRSPLRMLAFQRPYDTRRVDADRDSGRGWGPVRRGGEVPG
jgi:SAM-dependent methyltransferase